MSGPPPQFNEDHIDPELISNDAAPGQHFIYRQKSVDQGRDPAAGAAINISQEDEFIRPISSLGSSPSPSPLDASSSPNAAASSELLDLPSLKPKKRELSGGRVSGSHSPSSSSGRSLNGTGASIDLSASGSQVIKLHLNPESARSVAGKSSRPVSAASAGAGWTPLSDENMILVREADALVRQSTANTILSSSSSSSAAFDSPESLLRIYGSYQARLSSFGRDLWPHTAESHPHLSPITLAAWGFFHHSSTSSSSSSSSSPSACPQDCVMCFACGVELCDFEPADEPESSHRNASRETKVPCAFLDAIDRVRMSQVFGLTTSASRNPELDLILQDMDDHEQAHPPSGSSGAHVVDIKEEEDDAGADSDALPILGSSGLPPALARTHSEEERKLIDLLEADSEKRRMVISTHGAEIRVEGTTVTLAKEVVNEQVKELQPVIVQLREPLIPFQNTSSSLNTLYFQVKIGHLTPDYPASNPAGDTIVTINDDEEFPLITKPSSSSVSDSSSASAPALSSTSYPSFIIGLTTSPIHAHSLPPGFEPVAGQDLLSIGLTSTGDCNLNGMGPLSGIIAMQNQPYCTIKPDASSASKSVLKSGDVIGCWIDLDQRIMNWCVNGTFFGPILIPTPVNATNEPSALPISSYHFYPTICFLHAHDEFEIQYCRPNAISGNEQQLDPLMRPTSYPPPSADLYRQLFQSCNFPSLDTQMKEAVTKLHSGKPDLGLVLDQTNVNTGRRSAGSVVAQPKSSTPTTVQVASRNRTASAVTLGASSSSSSSSKSATPAGFQSIIPGPVVISKVLPGLSADLAGLRVGDQVKAINGTCIILLKDAVSLVTAALPAAILTFEIVRAGRTYILPLTLGAKGMDQGAFGPLARWAQYQQKCMEWIGPPVFPPFQPVFVGQDPSAAIASISGKPPGYDAKMAATKPWSGIEHVRAVEVALMVQQRLLKHKAPLYLPDYITLQARMKSFQGQMQAWTMQKRTLKSAAADSASSSSSPASPSSSSSSLLPPKPLDVALHGFFYAPVAGFPGRVVCFACGVVLPSVNSIAELLQAHRALARQNRSNAAAVQAAANSNLALDRPPSYHRTASLLPANLDTGCIFLTIYDSVVSSLQEKAQLKLAAAAKAQQRRTHPPSSSAAIVPMLPTSQSMTEVVIDVEADVDSVDGLKSLPAAPSNAGLGSLPSGVLNSGRHKMLAGPIMSNKENLARGSPLSSSTSSVAMLPPPDYALALEDATVPIGAASPSPEGSHEADGIVWQSPKQASARVARVGEFTAGSVDLRGKQPLSAMELHQRNRGREQYQQPLHFQQPYGGVEDDNGIELVPMAANDPIPYVPPPPPPPPMQVLKEFFLGGNPLFLLCKVPFFIIILPFFLVYECLKGLYNGAIWCCDALQRCCERWCNCLSRACQRCCSWISNMCGRCWNFLCCTILCEGICIPISNALNKYCCTPLYRCCSWICVQIGKCCRAMCDAISACFTAIANLCTRLCTWINVSCCQPIARCITSCCTAIGNCCRDMCNMISSCLSRCCDAISRCCDWFWTPICDALGRCLSAIWRCLTMICDAIYDCLAYICNGIWRCISTICDAIYRCISAICSTINRCLTAIWNAIASCCTYICNALSTCCSWTCHQLSVCFHAIWRCIDYVIFQPIIWLFTKIWECIKITVEYIIIIPAKAIWACLSAIASFIWTYILTPIGEGIAWVGSMISACFRAVAGAIWAVLSAIGNGIAAIFSAIYEGVLAPMGRAIRSAGRAIADLC